jgi:hypothetical protein
LVEANPTGVRGATSMMQVSKLARKALELLKLVVGVKLFITLLQGEFYFDKREGGMRK